MIHLRTRGNSRRIPRVGPLLCAVFLLAVTSCAEPTEAPPPPLVVSATVTRGADGLAYLEFTARNDGRDVVHVSGCPNAPAYYLDWKLGDWAEMASVGVVCPANLVPQRLAIAPGASVSRSFTVAPAGTYRFRLLVDDPRGGDPLTVASNEMEVR